MRYGGGISKGFNLAADRETGFQGAEERRGRRLRFCAVCGQSVRPGRDYRYRVQVQGVRLYFCRYNHMQEWKSQHNTQKTDGNGPSRPSRPKTE